MGPYINCGLQEAIFLHQQMVEKVNIYFFMQIGVFKVIYLPNKCIKSKNCKKTYHLPCFLYTEKIKTTEGLNAIQEIPNVLWFLDTVI